MLVTHVWNSRDMDGGQLCHMSSKLKVRVVQSTTQMKMEYSSGVGHGDYLEFHDNLKIENNLFIQCNLSINKTYFEQFEHLKQCKHLEQFKHPKHFR